MLESIGFAYFDWKCDFPYLIAARIDSFPLLLLAKLIPLFGDFPRFKLIVERSICRQFVSFSFQILFHHVTGSFFLYLVRFEAFGCEKYLGKDQKPIWINNISAVLTYAISFIQKASERERRKREMVNRTEDGMEAKDGGIWGREYTKI